MLAAFGLLLIFGSYLIGSIPVGVLIGRARGFDPRKTGSGNVGMTNVARAGGRSAAVATLAGDLLKGLVPVVIARSAGFQDQFLPVFGLAAFLGSIFSVFLHFQGGKGVATSLGVWIGLDPAAVAIAVAVFAIVFAMRRVVSLGSVCAALMLPVAVGARADGRVFLAVALVMSAIVILRHRGNLQRLLHGQERAIKFGGRGQTMQ